LLMADAQRRVIPALKPFAGQRIVLREYARQAHDIYDRVGIVDMSFLEEEMATLLDDSGWLNPSGNRIMRPDPNNPGSKQCASCFEDPENAFLFGGGSIQIDLAASTKTSNAAHALENALKSEQLSFGLGKAPLRPILQRLLPQLVRDPDVIIVTIGRGRL
jgi:hypothetical protein